MSKVLARHTATVTMIPAADSLAPAAFKELELDRDGAAAVGGRGRVVEQLDLVGGAGASRKRSRQPSPAGRSSRPTRRRIGHAPAAAKLRAPLVPPPAQPQQLALADPQQTRCFLRDQGTSIRADGYAISPGHQFDRLNLPRYFRTWSGHVQASVQDWPSRNPGVFPAVDHDRSRT